MLGEACRQAPGWRERARRPRRAERQLLGQSLVRAEPSATASPARCAGRPAAPRRLHIEITESAAVADPGAGARRAARPARRSACGCRLDDFGTGYCSLSYLQQFPVDTLKIDRAFVQRIGEQGEGDEIVRLIVRLAETLKLDVVAEGTESAAQVAHLAALGCAYAQGYYFSHAVDATIVLARPAVAPLPIDLVR